ncbi:glycosyltransferase family 2 protein [Auraticoccus monumenti]|uniref:4,4'-diaponeurosporenoate glycosyltransferase n=1 Tax=Auraticoccus monumenti TaxID=675864 RepID=A0A1G6TIM0_9ACTN|nr:glycosyltransferase family A protein [Auraticoccus monumenti]SDD29022.1 Glycosyl transferase family 2 [Auraticoccus monumenti]
MSGRSAPRFSVVVPALDEGDHLAATLASLQAQDFAGGVELLVVDNGSTDDTVAVAERAGVRVVHEGRRGVCAARQRGVEEARGELVVSTDADTLHPRDWLSRLDEAFREHPGVVAVAGPCRYLDPPWWAAVMPPVGFALVAAVHALTGRVTYLTATNVAYRREGFPGYDVTLTQGGDEVDLLRRLRRVGTVHWDGRNPVHTSSRRMDQGLAHTVVVSYGYYYALASVVNRAAGRRVIGVAPAVRPADRELVRRRRRRWRAVPLALLAVAVLGDLGRRRRRQGGRAARGPE